MSVFMFCDVFASGVDVFGFGDDFYVVWFWVYSVLYFLFLCVICVKRCNNEEF